MAFLDDVKKRIGIYYTTAEKDAEVSTMIEGAKAFCINAGVPSAHFTAGSETPEALEMTVIWCKMAANTDPLEMRVNPVLTAIIAQCRTVVSSEESSG